jgi:hypothetical protein
MPVNIPQSLFDKYFDVIDSTFDIFGIDCQLVSIEKKEQIIYNPNNNLPINNSINNHRKSDGNINIGNKTIIETEVLTDIRLKVYWDDKQFIGIAGDIVIPAGAVQTIGFMTDLPVILKSKQLIIHKDIKQYKELRFERFSEPVPMGLKHNRYFSCVWKRV